MSVWTEVSHTCEITTWSDNFIQRSFVCETSQQGLIVAYEK